MTLLRRWLSMGQLFWGLLFGITLALSLSSKWLVQLTGWGWLAKYPRSWVIPVDKWISAAMTWLVEDAAIGPVSFRHVTRLLSTIVEAPYGFVRQLLVDGFFQGQGQQAVAIAPSLSWVAITYAFIALGYAYGRIRLAVITGLCFVYLAVFGQWASAMVTLASVMISVPLGVVCGSALGIASYRHPRFEALLRPVLDLMQTVPVFAYLVPILFMFGFGPMAALVATVIYAMPPMVRITTLALKAVPPEVVEAGQMAGCSKRQMLWKILLPSARSMMMVGVNQVIMLSLNMVIIASMIGAGGLGYDVLTALRKLDIGGGVMAGVAIVALAIALDRISQAMASHARVPKPAGAFVRRQLLPISVAIVTISTLILGMIVPAIQTYPDTLMLTMGGFWEALIKWINLNLYDTIEAWKVLVLTFLLVPVKSFFVGIPWAWGITATALAAWRMGGLALGTMALCMAGFIATAGLWPEAMITIYLCGVSVLLAMVFGVPIGIWAGQSDRANSVIGVIIDTLQTLPSFVYLIPVVMLFRVGDFSAMVAVVLYSIVPSIRYAAHGIRNVDPQLIEAGLVSGCTKWQLLRRIKLPLALPSLLLGLNQTIMLALSMLVITALVGTRDLGQQVYIALTKANTGLGIVAGLSVAFIAIIVDRMLSAAAKRAKHRMGQDAAT